MSDDRAEYIRQHTEHSMTWMLAHRSKFNFRRNIMIPNASGSLGLPWESDLILISKHRYLTEIEIKVSKSDLLADAAKDKFKSIYAPHWQLVKQFYYAVPEHLVSAVPDSYRSRAGIISVSSRQHKGCKVVHKAPRNREAKPMSQDDVNKALYLLSLRYWDDAFKIRDNQLVFENGFETIPSWK